LPRRSRAAAAILAATLIVCFPAGPDWLGVAAYIKGSMTAATASAGAEAAVAGARGTASAVREAAPVYASRRKLLAAGVSGLAVGGVFPGRADAQFGRLDLPLTNLRYEEVVCDPDKGETIRGTKATNVLAPRCVQVTATTTNPRDEVLTRVGVFGRVDDKAAETSVLANAIDGATDVGQSAIIERVPKGEDIDVTFRFVAALPKNGLGKPLPELEFIGMKAVYYGQDKRWEPLTECELNPAADECN